MRGPPFPVSLYLLGHSKLTFDEPGFHPRVANVSFLVFISTWSYFRHFLNIRMLISVWEQKTWMAQWLRCVSQHHLARGFEVTLTKLPSPRRRTQDDDICADVAPSDHHHLLELQDPAGVVQVDQGRQRFRVRPAFSPLPPPLSPLASL